MAKIRKTASIENGLMEVIKILSEEEIQAAIGKGSSYVRKCSNPDLPQEIDHNDSFKLDKACVLKGKAPPLLTAHEYMMAKEFDEKFAAEAQAKGHEVRGQQVLALLSGDVRPEMVEALRRIKTQYKVGCITNNVKNAGKGPGMASSSKKAESVAEVMGMFDFILESSKAGIRKPNPKIYQMACDEISIEPKDAITSRSNNHIWIAS